MKFPVAAMAAALLTLTLASCARREPEDVNAVEQRSLDAWAEANLGVAAARQSNGVWVEFLDDGNPESAPVGDTTVWVSMRYTSRDLSGNVFATRDSVEALRQRTFSPHTYYVPEFRYCGLPEYTGGITEGRYHVLRDELTKPDGTKTRLREGSRVKIYMPSYLAYSTYGSSNDQGFGGQYPLGGTRIVVEELTVSGIVKNPLSHEEETVERFARDLWGKERKDTLAKGLYIDTVAFRPRASLLEKFPQMEFDKKLGLTADSTAKVWYIGRFLPTPEYPNGFVFDSNITEVYDGFFNRRKNENYTAQKKTLAALSYNIIGENETDDNKLIGAYGKVMPKLRRGQWCRMVFTSSYGYGSLGMSRDLILAQQRQNEIMQYYSYASMYGGGYGSGMGYNPYAMQGLYTQQSSSSDLGVVTEVQPYTPLIFDIYIEYPYGK